MASVESVLKLVLMGEDRVSPVMSKVADSVKSVGDKAAGIHGPTDVAKAALIGLGGALGAVGVKKFADDSMSAFKGVAGEAMSMSRATGMSIEDASRLNFAMQQSGVSTDSASKAIKALDKSLGSAASSDGKAAAAADEHRTKLEGQIAALEKIQNPTAAQKQKLEQLQGELAKMPPSTEAASSALGKMGIQYKDSQDKMIPMAQLLPQIAEKFKQMPDGPEKSALAMKLFGKSGMDMIPFLNKGADGVEDLMKKSDAFGMTVSGPMTKAMKDSKAATREWEAAQKGLSVQVGAILLPVLTQATTFVISNVMPMIQQVIGFVREHNSQISAAVPIIAGVAAVIGTVIGVVRAWSAAQAILNAVMAANPIVIEVALLVALVAALVVAYNTNETFRNTVNAAWASVTAAIGAGATFIGQKAQQVGQFFTQLGTLIGQKADDIARFWANLGTQIAGGAQNIGHHIDGVRQFFTSLPGQIMAALASLPGQLSSMGGQMIDGMKNGIQAKAGELLASVQGTISNAVEGAKNLLGIHSPSKVFDEEIGQMTIEGAAVGAEKKADRFKSAVAGALAVPKAKPIAVGMQGDFRSSGRGGGLAGSLDGLSADQIRDAIRQGAHDGLAEATVTVEIDGQAIEARVLAVMGGSARRSLR